MRKTKFNKWLTTYTKWAVSIILVVSLIDMQLSYILAFLGKDQIAETLSGTVATTIVGVMGGYFVKALFETFFEKREERIKREEEALWNDNSVHDGGTSDCVTYYESDG